MATKETKEKKTNQQTKNWPVQGKTAEFACRELWLARGTTLFCSHYVTFCRTSHHRLHKGTPS